MDSTGKVTKDGEWLYRFVGLFRDSGTQVDFVPDNRILLAPSLTWRPTTNTSWTLLGVYQKDKTGTTNGFLPREGTLLPSINGYIPRNRFVGDPSNDVYQTETRAISSLFEHSFNDAVKFTQNLRYAHVDGVYRSVYANLLFGRPVSRCLQAHGEPLRQQPATSRTTTSPSTTTSRAEGAHRRARTQGAVRRRLSRPFARVVRRRVQRRPDAVRSLCAGLHQRDLPALARTERAAKPDGLYAQDQMRLGPWLATIGVRQDYASHALSPDR